jgi:hypothetical protein
LSIAFSSFTVGFPESLSSKQSWNAALSIREKSVRSDGFRRDGRHMASTGTRRRSELSAQRAVRSTSRTKFVTTAISRTLLVSLCW